MSLPHYYRRPVRSSTVLRLARGLGAATRTVTRAIAYPYRAVSSWRRRRSSQDLVSGWGFDFNPSDLRGPDPIEDGSRFGAAAESANQGLTALSRALANPDPALRAQALEVICQFSAERAVRLLVGVLHDPDPKVRAAAADSAGRLGATGTVLSLIFALDDPEAEVRMAAEQAIERITDIPVRLESVDPAIRAGKIQELKKWWKEQRMSELTSHAHEGLD